MSTEPKVERRTTERRKPTVVVEAEHALDLMREAKYTGCFIGHANEGKVTRIEIPNPAGWGRLTT